MTPKQIETLLTIGAAILAFGYLIVVALGMVKFGAVGL